MNRLAQFRLIAIAFTLTLAGCSKETSKQSFPITETGAGEAQAALARTEGYDEASVISAAATYIRRSIPLSSAMVLRCWQREGSRPRVREACVLAWSTAGETSPEMDATLKSSLSNGVPRNLALAMARRKNLLASLSPAELTSLLAALHTEPAWVRAQTARDWLAKNSLPRFFDGYQLWNALAMPEEFPDPLSLGAAYSVAEKLGTSHSAKIIAAYCPPGRGELTIPRCLRFLSTLVDPRSGQGLDQTGKSLLPSRLGQGWTLFERSFPERARLLERYL